MIQALPKVLPVNELKNTANILQTCKESPVPIIITRNGYSEAVMMSVTLFEQLFAKLQAANLINEAVKEVNSGVKGIDGDEFFNAVNSKYAK